jgi:hypothetical protein
MEFPAMQLDEDGFETLTTPIPWASIRLAVLLMVLGT